MAVQAQTGTATPVGNGDMMERCLVQMEASEETALALSDSLTKGEDCKECVLCKSTQSVSRKGECNQFLPSGRLKSGRTHVACT